MAEQKPAPKPKKVPAKNVAAEAAKPSATATATQAEDRAFRKTRVGIVVSDKMAKTIVVRVDRLVRHPFYPRTVTRSNKFHAHDEAGAAKMGDRVKIMETRPISRTKRWRLVEVIRRGSIADADAARVTSGQVEPEAASA